MRKQLQSLLIIVLLFSACAKESELEELATGTNNEINLNNLSIKSISNNIKGFNWADARDNFVDGWVIPSGLSSSDSYVDIQEKTNTILSEWQDAGANTVRLPINFPSVSESWWDRYKGTVDKATDMGMNVILCCWESESSKDGIVDNLTDFWEMWQTVVDDYQDNSRVCFEVFNEPHGYSTSDLVELYNTWLTKYSDIPHNRIVLGGTGYSENVSNIGGYFSDCLLSQHLYSWWGNYTTIAEWENALTESIGDYGDRTVLTEFGATMSTGKDFGGDINDDAEIAFIQGMTSYCRINHVGSIYWPGLRDDDTYSLYTYDGSMDLVNASGLEQIQSGWETGAYGYYQILNRNSNLALDINGESVSSGANIIQWSWHGRSNQQWALIDEGNNYYRIINRNSGMALDVEAGSSEDGGNVIQWPWNGGDNQQWQLIDNGDGYCRIINKNSGKALDVSGSSTENGGNVIQWSWNGGDNQLWQLTEL